LKVLKSELKISKNLKLKVSNLQSYSYTHAVVNGEKKKKEKKGVAKKKRNARAWALWAESARRQHAHAN
jgi:hypothetical protein